MRRGRTSDWHFCSTSQSRNEPISLAHGAAGNGDLEQLVRFLATRLLNEPCVAWSGNEIAIDVSGLSQRACASGLVWRGEVV